MEIYLGPSIHCSSLAPFTGCLDASAAFLIDGILLGDDFGELVCAGEVLALWEGVFIGRCADDLSGLSRSSLGDDLVGRCSADEPIN